VWGRALSGKQQVPPLRIPFSEGDAAVGMTDSDIPTTTFVAFLLQFMPVLRCVLVLDIKRWQGYSNLPSMRITPQIH
jgi:hypothetical protein